MVDSLRTLCLLKMNSSMDIDRLLEYTDIPEELVKELKIMKIFNGNFKLVREGRFHTTSWAISICFNGSSWTFSSKTSKTSYLNIPPTINYCNFKIKQGKIVKGKFPLCNMKHFLDVIYGLVATEDSDAIQVDPDLPMKMAVKIDFKEFNTGRLIFEGPSFKSVLRMNVDRLGTRTLSHNAVGRIQSKDYHYEYFSYPMFLNETSEELDIHDVAEELDELEFDWEKEVEFQDPEMFQAWQIVMEGGLLDFWEVVNNTV